MASEAQIAANRRNAEKSTGPRTAAGKEAVGRNALRHGLRSVRTVVFDETEEEFQDFAAGIVGALAPADAYERALSERIAQVEWRLKRVWRMEAAAIDREAAGGERQRMIEAAAESLLADLPPKDAASPVARDALRGVAAEWSDDKLREFCAVSGIETAGEGAAQWAQPLAALGRYEAALERQLHRATVTLERHQAERRAAERPAARKAAEPRAVELPAAAAAPALPAPPPALAAMPALKSTEQTQFAAPPPPQNRAAMANGASHMTQ
jgi:hypothetical protein